MGDEIAFDCFSGKMFVCFCPTLFINSSFYVVEVNWFYKASEASPEARRPPHHLAAIKGGTGGF